MTFLAKDVMKRAATILQDNAGVRWPAPDLHLYLNDGLRDIAAMKPNARTKTVNLSLVSGSKQTLPDEYTVLSRVVRNMASPTVGAGAIRAISNTQIMDSLFPNWQDPSVVRPSKTVVHIIHDMADPRTFYVMPSNDGMGLIEVIVGTIPAPSAAPVTPLVHDDYIAPVDIADIYQSALTDYVLYRAYSKDSRAAGSAARAEAHLQLFGAAVSGFAEAELGMSLASYSNAKPKG